MSFNALDDLITIADGLGSVWLVRQGSPPEELGLLVPHALRRSVTTREAAASDGQYTVADVVWRLPVDEVDAPPRPGDVLRDATLECWTILAARRLALAAGWRVTTRRADLGTALTNRITILRATYSKGAGGAAVATWTAAETDVPARLQPHETTFPADAAALGAQARFRVYLAADVDFDEHCRIADAAGGQYRILTITRAERLGELTTLDVEALQ